MLSGGVADAGIDDDVGVFVGESEDFGAHGLAGDLETVESRRWHGVMAQLGRPETTLLGIGVDECDLSRAALVGAHHCKIGGDRGFADAAFDTTTEHDHAKFSLATQIRIKTILFEVKENHAARH